MIAGLGSFPLLKGKNQFAVTADMSLRSSRPRKVSKFFHGRKIIILAWSIINIEIFYVLLSTLVAAFCPCELRKTTDVVPLGFVITI